MEDSLTTSVTHWWAGVWELHQHCTEVQNQADTENGELELLNAKPWVVEI